MEKYCISIDWLQLYCICNFVVGVRDSIVSEAECDHIYMVREDISTALWTEVYGVYRGKLKVAVLCRAPRSSAMDKQGCTLKLENRVLYSKEWLPILRRILADLQLQYKGITRIDLCYDCNKLAGGRSVGKFLFDYATAAPYQEGHIVRVGSRRFSIHGIRNRGGAMEINSMRWGSQGSDIGAYCYNKSLEMIEIKEKPWILEKWEANGLINEWDMGAWTKLSDARKRFEIEDGKSADYVHTPVWRFEISIKSHAKDLLDLATGDLFQLSLDYIEQQGAIERLFYVYAQKAFHFRMSTGQKTIREYPDIKIFERNNVEVSQCPHFVSRYLDSGRTEKVCYNILKKMIETYSDLSSAQLNSLQSAMDFLLTTAGKKMASVRLIRQAQQLSNLRAHRFVAFDDALYLGSIEAARVARRDLSVDPHYSFIRSLIDATERELMVDKAIAEGAQVDGYPYGLTYSMPLPLPPSDGVAAHQ